MVFCWKARFGKTDEYWHGASSSACFGAAEEYPKRRRTMLVLVVKRLLTVTSLVRSEIASRTTLCEGTKKNLVFIFPLPGSSPRIAVIYTAKLLAQKTNRKDLSVRNSWRCSRWDLRCYHLLRRRCYASIRLQYSLCTDPATYHFSFEDDEFCKGHFKKRWHNNLRLSYDPLYALRMIPFSSTSLLLTSTALQLKVQ